MSASEHSNLLFKLARTYRGGDDRLLFGEFDQTQNARTHETRDTSDHRDQNPEGDPDFIFLYPMKKEGVVGPMFIAVEFIVYRISSATRLASIVFQEPTPAIILRRHDPDSWTPVELDES